MAMLDIEYRYSAEPPSDLDIRRKYVKEMENYIRSLVLEMQMADISVGFKMIKKDDLDRNTVLINGKTVNQILDGLQLVMLEPDEDSCGCNSPSKPITNIGRSELDWNDEHIEDISDVLMKNAIAKMYADMEADRIM